MLNYSTDMKILTSKKIFRGFKNASYLIIGYFLSVVINLIGFVYIARLLGPSDYGIYATVVAFVGLFSIVTFQGLKKVVLREGSKDLNQMSKYFEKTIGIKILFTFIAIIVCIVSSFFFPYSLQEKIYIILFSFTLFYDSFEGFFATVYQAAEKMQYNAALNILNRILIVSLAITFLYMGFGLFTLFIISLFSNFLTIIINFKLTKKFLIFKFWNKIKLDKTILKSALIFSILSFSVLLTTKIDLVMISVLGSSKDVGIYGVPYLITRTASTMRNLVATAFFPIFVKIFHKNIVRGKTLLKFSFLLGFGLLIIAIIGSFFSEQIIIFLFGLEYSESGYILSVLIFYLIISYFSIPFTITLQATHNENINLKICWIDPSLNIILNLLFFNIFGLIGIAYSTLVVAFTTAPIRVIITWRTLKKQNKII
jgi:O-antigen/teichoic acid export membrane protein